MSISRTQAPVSIKFKGIDEITATVQGIKKQLQSVATVSRNVGIAMTVGATMPIKNLVNTAIDRAFQYSEAFNDMRAVTQEAAVSFDALSNSAIKFAMTNPMTSAGIMGIMSELGRSGKNTTEIEKMYRAVANLSVAVRYGPSETAKTVTNMMNIFGKTS